jgi:large subunit ribosomal protein L1
MTTTKKTVSMKAEPKTSKVSKSKSNKSLKTSGKQSKAYKANKLIVDKAGLMAASIEDAVNLLLSLTHPNFKDGVTVEVHSKLNINPTKADQIVRSSVVLPHGTGKTVRVAAFVLPENEARATAAGAVVVGSDLLIEEIKKTGKLNFDAAIAEPEIMKKLGPIARVLGTAGVMPTPKSETVGNDIEGMIKMLTSGKIDIKNDKSGNIHLAVGKINSNFNTLKLVENIEAAIDAIEKAKPEGVKKKYMESVHIATTMSPSVRVK